MRTSFNTKARWLMTACAAATGIGSAALPGAAHAQALQPVVDVCTGIRLPRSAVTEVIGAVNQPIVDQIETTVNGLTTVTVILAPLATITDLNINLSPILANAAAGDPITLQLVDTNGNLIAASDQCNVAADNFTLNQQGGVAIGGNRISGLGADGQAASAAELDAIAIGNNAATTAGATGAVALGTGARATAAGGVALGAGSVADRGPQIAYAAPGLGGTYDSVGAVSVGSATGQRQITNVAPGTADSDAATVGQVLGAVAAANADAVRYDDATHTRVTLNGAGGTVVAGVAPGALSGTSTEAVNGAQLFATNQQVAANTGAITAIDGRVAQNTTNIAANTSAITAIDARVTQNTTNISANTGAITAIDARVTQNSTTVAALDGAAVKYDDASHTVATLDGAGGTRVTGLANGAVTATSTDAVTGAQLFATNQAIAAATGTPGLAVTYDDATLARATLGGASGTTLGNVAAGAVSATSAEAVNGSQLYATNQQVAANGTAITNVDNRVTIAYARLDNIDTSVTSIDARVTSNTTQIAAVQAQVANVPVAYVADADGATPSAVPTNTARFAGAGGGAVRVTGIADGQLAAGSTDAVNGSQLAATNTAVAQNRTDIDRNTADIAAINTNLRGSTVAAVQYSNPGTPTVGNGGTITNDVTFVGADASLPVMVHNVAAGTAPTDAVNVGQLQGAVSQLQGSIAQSFADARDYTDARVAQLGFDLADLRDDAFSGTAAAMAMASIPQTIDGSSMIGGSVGHYRGQTAFGVGLSASANDGRIVLKASGTMDTNGKGGFAAGAGFSF